MNGGVVFALILFLQRLTELLGGILEEVKALAV